MTATMSPIEAPIFEDMTIRDLERHYDETPVCADCGGPADYAVGKVCCPKQITLCAGHYSRLIRLVALHLPNGIHCKHCKVEYFPPQTFGDIFRVVDL